MIGSLGAALDWNVLDRNSFDRNRTRARLAERGKGLESLVKAELEL